MRPSSLVPVDATVDANGKRICGASIKNGSRRCQTKQVLSNGRCRMHGGTVKRGLASPNTKTGRYSLDLPTRVLARYEAAMADPTLLSLKDDIALVQAAIAQTLDEIKDAEMRPDLDAILGSDGPGAVSSRSALRQRSARVHVGRAVAIRSRRCFGTTRTCTASPSVTFPTPLASSIRIR